MFLNIWDIGKFMDHPNNGPKCTEFECAVIKLWEYLARCWGNEIVRVPGKMLRLWNCESTWQDVEVIKLWEYLARCWGNEIVRVPGKMLRQSGRKCVSHSSLVATLQRGCISFRISRIKSQDNDRENSACNNCNNQIELQWGSEIRPFKNQIHSKTGRFWNQDFEWLIY